MKARSTTPSVSNDSDKLEINKSGRQLLNTFRYNC